MVKNKVRLFSEFPPISTEQWLKKVNEDLKGVDFEKKLVWKTNEGFKVQPFYRSENIASLKNINTLPGEFPFLRGNTREDNKWLVRQDMVVSDFAYSNAKALKLLNKGVDSLGFTIKGSDVNKDNVLRLIEGIDPEQTELNFITCQSKALALAGILMTEFTDKKYNPIKVQGSIDFDPIKYILVKGFELPNWKQTAVKIVDTCAQFPRFNPITVNAISLNDSGSYIYQELGYALAWGNEYINTLMEGGISADKALQAIRFNLGISSAYFMEIAKIRAARLLWAEISKQYSPVNIQNCQMIINAGTSFFNLSLYDSYVNLLRTQTEAMSAAIAGVHSISINPFDKVYSAPSEFSERLARNQQLLLKEECHFDKVVDPSGGSYYIETLTASLAQEAWKLFQSVESNGGMLSASYAGTVQDMVNESGKARRDAIATRRESLIGTNQYPNFNEQFTDIGPVDLSDILCEGTNCGGQFKSLSSQRMASEFEAVRLTTERSGKRPKVFMLTIGNLSMRQARSQFSSNFFACAGYEVIDNLGFKSVEEGVDAAIKTHSDIVVLCSSDEEYAEYAVPAFKVLNGRAIFVVAGNPACAESLKNEGVENFIHARQNVLSTLKEYNAKLGIN